MSSDTFDKFVADESVVTPLSRRISKDSIEHTVGGSVKKLPPIRFKIPKVSGELFSPSTAALY